jgi:hypothetical protein
MSISGNLEDVSVAEVMQFIHLGRRTGTLTLVSDGRRAEVGFHRGKIVSAWAPGIRRLGELLVHRGLIGETTLVTALRIQENEATRRSLGQILVSNAVISSEAMRRAVTEHIESTIFELVTWTRGTFQFALDDLQPVDDIAMYPDEVVPDLDLNTQMLLLEATRIFDERNRGAEGESLPRQPSSGGLRLPGNLQTRSDASGVAAPSALAERHGSAPTNPEPDDAALAVLERTAVGQAPARTRVQLVTPDQALATAVSLALGEHSFEVAVCDLADAAAAAPGERAPIVVADLRQRHVNLAELQTMRKLHPRAALVAVLDDSVPPARAYAAGALVALPADADAIAACVENLENNRQTIAEGSEHRTGFARIRRVVTDIRSGLMSATMALNLMNIISESVDRAVLFLVRRDELLALGAFGFSNENRPLAEVTRGLKLKLIGDDAFAEAIAAGKASTFEWTTAALPSGFASLVGRPRAGSFVLFPVLGSERVISLIYADNGNERRPIEELEILELATAQVGIAFENELLRRQLAGRNG